MFPRNKKNYILVVLCVFVPIEYQIELESFVVSIVPKYYKYRLVRYRTTNNIRDTRKLRLQVYTIHIVSISAPPLHPRHHHHHYRHYHIINLQFLRFIGLFCIIKRIIAYYEIDTF